MMARLDHPLLRGQMPVLFGLVLPLATFVIGNGPGIFGRLAAILITVLFWQVLFANLRKQAFGLEGLSMALITALLVPDSAPIWQLVLGSTFGAVIGLLIFGGYGRNVLHPALVALTFLMFSFAGDGYRQSADLALWSLAPALIFLVASGQANWRILAGAVLGLAGLGWLQNGSEALPLLSSGLFWLVLLFLVADPVASAATNWGRAFHGLLFGVLVALFLQAGTALSALLFAALMSAIFAPLIDQAVIAINAGWRARRHG